MTFDKLEITTAMESILIELYKKETQPAKFWKKLPPYHLSKYSYDHLGLIVTDLQKLTEHTYKTVLTNVKKLVELDMLRLNEQKSGKNYVLTENGFKKIEEIIKKYRAVLR